MHISVIVYYLILLEAEYNKGTYYAIYLTSKSLKYVLLDYNHFKD